jgi:hypothetical protein
MRIWTESRWAKGLRGWQSYRDETEYLLEKIKHGEHSKQGGMKAKTLPVVV